MCDEWSQKDARIKVFIYKMEEYLKQEILHLNNAMESGLVL